MVWRLERFEPQQDIGGLPEDQPEIGPFEGDVAESDEGAAGRLLRLEPLVVGLNPRERDARLHAALHFDQRQLHVDGRGEVGLRQLELELHDLARLGSRRQRRRTFNHGAMGNSCWAVTIPTSVLHLEAPCSDRTEHPIRSRPAPHVIPPSTFL
jgi:hypothetical protein